MGYHRPIDSFNAGKQAEQAERCYFREPGIRRACSSRLLADMFRSALTS